jgi:DHA1 family bicyclomycin/chloramphenicol resistance-like MFS transporter
MATGISGATGFLVVKPRGNKFGPKRHIKLLDVGLLRISPASPAFIVLLLLLAIVPGFAVDMTLPTLVGTSTSLRVAPSGGGLAIGCFMLSYGAAPLIYGPISNGYGRKPVLIFGCAAFLIACVGCALASSLLILLIWRVAQGAGAAAMMLSMVIIPDLFKGSVAREKMSYLLIAIYVSPIVAPTAGAELLDFGGWRFIQAVLAVLGFGLLLSTWLCFEESARPDDADRLRSSAIVRQYVLILQHPVCRGYIFASAFSFSVVLAYATGSSLFFIGALGLTPEQYGLICGVTALASIGGAFLDSRLSMGRIAPAYPLMIGLAALAIASTLLLSMALVGWMPLPIVISLFVVVTFSAGVVVPGMTHGVMQPLPEISGVVSVVANCISIMAGALSSGLVAILFNGDSALSMTATMAIFSLLALVSFLVMTRPAGHAVMRPRTG